MFILLFYPVKINNHYQIGLLLEILLIGRYKTLVVFGAHYTLQVPVDDPGEDQEN